MITLRLFDRSLEFDPFPIKHADKEIQELSPEEAANLSSTSIESGEAQVSDQNETVIAFRKDDSNFTIQAANPKTTPGSPDAITGLPPAFPFPALDEIVDGESSGMLYSLEGKVTQGISTGTLPIGGGASGSIGFESNSSVIASHLRLYGPAPVTVEQAVDSDLVASRFLFALDPAAVSDLTPEKDYLISEYQAGLNFEAKFTWGEVFHSSPSFLRALASPEKVLTMEKSGGNLFEAAVVAEVVARASLATRLHLIASRPDAGDLETALFELRQARNHSLSVSGGVSIRTKIQEVDLEGALSSLLGTVIDGADLNINKLRTSILDAQASLFNALPDNPGALALSHLSKEIKIPVDKLLRPLESFQSSRREILDAAKFAKLGDAELEALLGKLQVFAKEAEVPLSDDSIGILQALQVLAPIKGASLPTLHRFLSFTGNSEAVVDTITEISQGSLDQFQAELETLLTEDTWLPKLTTREKTLIEFLKETDSINVVDLIGDLGLEEVWDEFLANSGFESLSEAWDTFEELVSSDKLKELLPVDVKDLVTKLEEWFDVEIPDIPAKLYELTRRLSSVLAKETEFTARGELTRSKESESFLTVEYKALLSDPASFAKFYNSLLYGDLEELKRIHANQPDQFGKFELLSAETARKRNSFKVRFLSGFNDGHRELAARTLTDGSGAQSHIYQLAVGVSKQGTSLEGDRVWRNSLLFNAQTEHFAKAHKITTDDFRYRLELNLEVSAPLIPGNSKKKKKTYEKRMNRNLVRYLARSLGYSKKPLRGADSLFDALKNNLPQENCGLKVSLQMEHEAVIGLFEHSHYLTTKDTNFVSFQRSWLAATQGADFKVFPQKAIHGKKAKKKGNAAVAALQNLGSVCLLPSRPAALEKSIEKLGKLHLVACDEKPFHPVYPFALMDVLLAILPRSQAGWKVSAVYTEDGRQTFMGSGPNP